MDTVWCVFVTCQGAGAYLARYGGCAFADFHRYSFDRYAFTQQMFDLQALGIRQMFVFCHDVFPPFPFPWHRTQMDSI
jgi:hypothetical protein